MSYTLLFQQATDDIEPYPYQVRLASEPWPDALNIPTGLGKTAAHARRYQWMKETI